MYKKAGDQIYIVRQPHKCPIKPKTSVGSGEYNQSLPGVPSQKLERSYKLPPPQVISQFELLDCHIGLAPHQMQKHQNNGHQEGTTLNQVPVLFGVWGT
ncbi:hypothetical protein RJ641_004807 [Dillenia turbinata]|uniref:Uncharacterized protein n=1 Tax=Dillenia turbinata TaxID=194707 RepID=A0AAN8V9A4_9MAGN